MAMKRPTIVDMLLFPSIALLAVTSVACIVLVNAVLFGVEIPVWIGMWGIRAIVLGMSGLILAFIVDSVSP